MTEHRYIEADTGSLAFVLRGGEPNHPLHVLMLHGRGGDERVMWVLESILPEGAPVAAIRGRFEMPDGGYQWTEQSSSIDSKVEDFSHSVVSLRHTLDILHQEHGFALDRLVLMGFSQGGALSFAFANALDLPPLALVVLAGFYPKGLTGNFRGLPVFWGHGSRDEHVPVERARADVEWLELNGAMVHYCEADVTHKIGVECTRGLSRWLETIA